MALFVPDSEVWLLQEIPFTPDYRNTGLFTSKEEQFRIMCKRAFHHISECTYIRENGRIRLELPIKYALRCNYIIYRNTAFNDKYFYAFVTGVSYVNNETSDITWQLDVMQTFLFDYSLKECFIERQHVSDDRLGANLVPEGLDIGELVWGAHDQIPATYGKIYVAATFDKQLNNYPGGMFNNVYTGLCINEFNNASEVTAFINAATSANKLNGIVSIFQSINYNTISTYSYSLSRSAMFGNYTPRNNKLYTYPYCFLQILGNDGGNAIFRWEYFNQFGQANFQIATSPSLSSQMLITPTNYKNKSGYNPSERMIIENVMLCSWNGDTYKANLAQTIGKYMVPAEVALITGGKLIDKIIGKSGDEETQQTEKEYLTPSQAYDIMKQQGSMEGWTPNIVGGTLSPTQPYYRNVNVTKPGEAPFETAYTGLSKSILNSVQTALASAHDPESMSRQAQNPGASTDILYMLQQKSPYFVQMCITPQYAKIIDDYFTMYGYQVNKVGLPTNHNRKRYTYVKTAGAIIEAMFPSGIAQAIENIYNNGICFWYIDDTDTKLLEAVGEYGDNPTI